MDKQQILNLIIAQLRSDLAMSELAVKVARDTASHADCLGSSKYETMGLEASYLAQGQGLRLLEVERALNHFTQLSLRESASAIGLSSLVELEDEHGERQLLWLAADAGGLKIDCLGAVITVITARSPLGSALIGKICDDDIAISIAGKERCYMIRSVL